MKKIILTGIITAVVFWFLPAWTMIHEYGHAFMALVAGVNPAYISFPEQAITHVSGGLNIFQEDLVCQGGWMFEVATVFILLVFRKSPFMLGVVSGVFLNTLTTVFFAIITPGGDFRHAYSWLGIPFVLLLQTVAASSIILAIRRHYVRLQHSRGNGKKGRKLSTGLKAYN